MNLPDPIASTPQRTEPDRPDRSRRGWVKLALSAPMASAAGSAGRAAVVVSAALFPGAAARAHGPTPQRIDESIEIDAPPQAVWAFVGDFGDFAAWNPWLSASQADKGNTPGSTRTLTRAQGGGQLTEELDDYQADKMILSYRGGRRIDPEVLPASSYSGRLQVEPAGSGSKVSFRGRAYRADTGNEAPKGRDDKAVVAAMKAYIVPALQALKAKLETK